MLTGHAHPVWDFEGGFGITVAAALPSCSGTDHISRNVPWDQGRKDVYLVCDLLPRLAVLVGALSPQQGGSGGSSPQARRWNLGFILLLAISVCCLQRPTLFIDTNPQREQVAGQSPLLFEVACVTESETLELSVAVEPVKDSCEKILKKSAWE